MLLIIFITSGEFNLFSNYIGNACFNKANLKLFLKKNNGKTKLNYKDICLLDIISIFSLANKRNSYSFYNLQNWLNFTTIISLILLMSYFRKQQKLLHIKCDESEVTPSDYTIYVKNIPKNLDINYIEELGNFFSNKVMKDEVIRVSNINLGYNIDDLVALKKKIDMKIKEKVQFLIKNDQIGVNKINNEIKLLKADVIFETKKIKNDQKKFSGKAFISFFTEQG